MAKSTEALSVNLWRGKVWRLFHAFPQHPRAKARMILKQAWCKIVGNLQKADFHLGCELLE